MSLHPKSPLHQLASNQLDFLRGVLVIIRQTYLEWVLIGIVVQIDESIVEEESRVALLPIRVVHLFPSFHVFQGLYDEAFNLVRI